MRNQNIESILEQVRQKGICEDSRIFQKGQVFILRPGPNAQHYFKEVIQKGADLVVVKRGGDYPVGPKYIEVDNVAETLSYLSSINFPKQPKNIVGITGTNGKTSIADLLYQLWKMKGYKTASLGTMGVKGIDLPFQVPGMTTLPALDLHKVLNYMGEEGTTHLAMEISSHALHQRRSDHVKVSCAVFTNLTQDHLDYHDSMEDYFQQKARLFTDVFDGTAVINIDDEWGKKLCDTCQKQNIETLTFSVKQRADLKAENIRNTDQGIQFDLLFNDGSKHHDLFIPLIGDFQLSNVLAVLGVLKATENTLKPYLDLLKKLNPIPGRLEKPVPDQSVFVDYAHTPDALEKALKSLRPYTKKRLMVVLGCGGDRDKEKRPLMGAVANDLADYVIVTDDNPRYEDPDFIRKCIRESSPKAIEIGDRKDAILSALNEKREGDVLLIAGKGHEEYQIIKGVQVLFSDSKIVKGFYSE